MSELGEAVERARRKWYREHGGMDTVQVLCREQEEHIAQLESELTRLREVVGNRGLPDCTGCTDPRSEGTHQMDSKQHCNNLLEVGKELAKALKKISQHDNDRWNWDDEGVVDRKERPQEIASAALEKAKAAGLIE